MEINKKELKKTSRKFRQLASRTLNAHYNEVNSIIRMFVEYIDDTPIINEYIQSILVEYPNLQQRQLHGTKQYDYRKTEYSPEAGQASYDTARLNSGRTYLWVESTDFIDYADDQILRLHQSPDSVVGAAKVSRLFSEKMIPCTKTLYNWIDKGFMETQKIDLILKVRRETKSINNRKNKTFLGKSIDLRPEPVTSREEFGHWEIDTVVGLKSGQDQVLLTLIERKTRFEILQKIEGKNALAVQSAIENLQEQSGHFFKDIFKTITSDNGVEFSTLSACLDGIVEVYFTHPYSSWERGTNERHNGLIRRFIPKGSTMRRVSRMYIKRVENWMNQLPRKVLGYKTPKQAFLDETASLLAV